eukprot:SAG22_NODE_767_length_7375_cov_24.094055_9_plen_53_part_00
MRALLRAGVAMGQTFYVLRASKVRIASMVPASCVYKYTQLYIYAILSNLIIY